MKPRRAKRVVLAVGASTLIVLLVAALAERRLLLRKWHGFRLRKAAEAERWELARRLEGSGAAAREAAERWYLSLLRQAPGDLPTKDRAASRLVEMDAGGPLAGTLGVLRKVDHRPETEEGPLAVVLCIDKSGSTRPRLAEVKRSVLELLSRLPAGSQFAIVFFDSHLARFPSDGSIADASGEMRAAVAAWADRIQSGSATCTMPALVAALEFARKASTPRRMVLLVSDGFTTCPGHDATLYGAQTLQAVQARNTEGIPIHAITAGAAGQVDERWMTSLARENGGLCIRVLE